MKKDFICYIHEGWSPRIRPASSRREWMDSTPEAYAYRCLPLKIANERGWEILSPCGFSAVWSGGALPEDVSVEADPGCNPADVPEALFGSGTLTFHIAGLLRTPPGWDLWVGGPPNHPKDAIAPLSGVIETDWSPFTFTMNWRFTRPGQAVRFEENEPFAFIFPVQRNALADFEPRIRPITDAPELARQFDEWSRSRDAFQKRMRDQPRLRPADKWQKFYHRGTDATGCPHVDDHQTRVKLAPFAGAPAIPTPTSEPRTPPIAGRKPEPRGKDIELAKRNWLLQSLLALRNLSPGISAISRLENISGDQFRDEYYALNRPLVLTNAVAAWPALDLWSPEYLKIKIGSAEIEFQGARQGAEHYERHKDTHKATMAFDRFIDMIQGSSTGNDAYITAYNAGRNAAALSPLAEDIGSIDHLLTPDAKGMIWIGAGGTFTPLHHDLTNNLLVQVTGTKHVVMAPPHETPRLRNDKHVFSAIEDLENITEEQFPGLSELKLYRTELRSGEALFIPLGWWHQVASESFSVSLTFTNFNWPNDFYIGFPAD